MTSPAFRSLSERSETKRPRPRRGACRSSIERSGTPSARGGQRLEVFCPRADGEQPLAHGGGRDVVRRVLARQERPGIRLIVERDELEREPADRRGIRPDLARTVVQAGWNLTELRTVGESLEDIFLELTRAEKKETESAAA